MFSFCPTMRSLESRKILSKQEDLKHQKMENKNNDFMAFIRIIKIRKAAINVSGESFCYEIFK